jgi:hypothetical protein
LNISALAGMINMESAIVVLKKAKLDESKAWSLAEDREG